MNTALRDWAIAGVAILCMSGLAWITSRYHALANDLLARLEQLHGDNPWKVHDKTTESLIRRGHEVLD